MDQAVAAILTQFCLLKRRQSVCRPERQLMVANKAVKSDSDFELITWLAIKYIRFRRYFVKIHRLEVTMLATAKVFTTGNSQAIRLPKAFRVNAREVWISKNEVTGEITLKPKDDDQRKRNLALLFKMIEEHPLPDDFLSEGTRRNDPPRNPFEDWAEDPSGHGVKE
jgi:antitoxin VapB